MFSFQVHLSNSMKYQALKRSIPLSLRVSLKFQTLSEMCIYIYIFKTDPSIFILTSSQVDRSIKKNNAKTPWLITTPKKNTDKWILVSFIKFHPFLQVWFVSAREFSIFSAWAKLQNNAETNELMATSMVWKDWRSKSGLQLLGVQSVGKLSASHRDPKFWAISEVGFPDTTTTFNSYKKNGGTSRSPLKGHYLWTPKPSKMKVLGPKI